MCEFCKKIIKTNKEYIDERINGGDFIFQNEESFCVLIDTGDSGCLGCLNDIKYCPICGRKLTDGEENEVETDKYFEELLDEAKKLNDRHQSDCITINKLNVTIDVLVNKLARLREVHGL